MATLVATRVATGVAWQLSIGSYLIRLFFYVCGVLCEMMPLKVGKSS